MTGFLRARADVEDMQALGQAQFFKRDGHFDAVGRREGIDFDHEDVLCDCALAPREAKTIWKPQEANKRHEAGKDDGDARPLQER
jgi:hypothetical protein